MDLHAPSGPVHSLRDFVVHIGIVLALQRLMTPAPAGAPEEPIVYPDINLDFTSSASGDTAIATQALNELPYATVRRYAEAFATLKLFLDEERTGISLWQDLRRFGTSAQALTQSQRIAFIEALRRYDSFTYAVDLIGKGILRSCDEALGMSVN